MIVGGQIDAPAKINLTLEILARRADGYHGVRSVMLPIGLHDTLRWEPAQAFTFISGNGAPAGADNLVVRALHALGIEPPIKLSLEKNIPSGSGLGGGSSDAAAVLRAAASGAFGDLGERDYVALARSLGSDVPFFLVQTGALVEGSGERVTAVGVLPAWWIVLIVPPLSIETGQAYAALDAARGGDYEPRPRKDSASLVALEAVQRGDFAAAVAASTNDFETLIASREPRVAAALDALRAAGARLARLSGSGAGCFALAQTQDEARAVMSRLPPAERARAQIFSFAQSGDWRR